jgi:hypothetical protein
VEGAVGDQHERLHDVEQRHDAHRLLALVWCVCVCVRERERGLSHVMSEM